MSLDAFRLDGKNALVTGSHRGIGAAIAVALGGGWRECGLSWAGGRLWGGLRGDSAAGAEGGLCDGGRGGCGGLPGID